MLWAIISTGASVALLVLALRAWNKQRVQRAALKAKLDEAMRKAGRTGSSSASPGMRHRLN